MGTRRGWPVYIALSVFLNAVIASAIDIPRTAPAPRETPPIRLNLASTAAQAAPALSPRPASAQTASEPIPVAPPPVMEKIVETVTRAPVQPVARRPNIPDPPAPPPPPIGSAQTAPPPAPPAVIEKAEKIEPVVKAVTRDPVAPAPRRPKAPGRPAPEPHKTAQTTTPPPQPQKDRARKVALLHGDQGRSASTVIHDANYRRQQPPVYPRRALELGQQGTVTLHAEIMLDGLPRGLKVAQSSGHKLLDSAALEAVRKWEFEPVRVNHKKVAGWMRVPVRFVIQH